MDLFKGFNQMELDEESKKKAGFITSNGIYEYNRIPFGLQNGPAFFTAAMKTILGDLKFVKVYIDDITISSNTEEEHLEHIQTVIDRLNEHNLRINPAKCTWFANEIKLLGHVIDKHVVKMDPEKIDKIKNFKTPKNIKDVESFLGCTGYYRKFIRRYASIAAPLHRLTIKNMPFKWTQECDSAFNLLKEIFCSYPILRNPDFSRP